jgi:DNA-binding transcriptional regulator YiaG
MLENAARRDRQATDAQLTLIGKADMKNTTKKRKVVTQPSKKTSWAYWMQAIEPTSEAINKAFPDYHPQWVQLSQRTKITGESFKAMREMLHMDREQCAAYLRVDRSCISKWEIGTTVVPFAAFELLRVVFESVHFKLSHPEWDGWFIGAHGELNSPDVGGRGFTPELLNASFITFNQNASLRSDLMKAQTQLDEARAENTKLRQMFVAQGVVDDLAAMQSTINELMARIATAKILPFPAIADQLLEKTA